MSGEHCADPDKCPAISTITGELKLVHIGYIDSQRAMLETTKELSKTNIALVQNTAEVTHLCSDLKRLEGENKEQHNVLFNKNRDRETEVGKFRDKLTEISTSQATKLSTGDLLKILVGTAVIAGVFIASLEYLK